MVGQPIQDQVGVECRALDNLGRIKHKAISIIIKFLLVFETFGVPARVGASERIVLPRGSLIFLHEWVQSDVESSRKTASRRRSVLEPRKCHKRPSLVLIQGIRGRLNTQGPERANSARGDFLEGCCENTRYEALLGTTCNTAPLE